MNDLVISHGGMPGGCQIFRVSGEWIEWQLKSVGQSTAQSQFRIFDLNTVPAEYGGKTEGDEPTPKIR